MGRTQASKEIRALLKGIERHQHGFHVLVGDFNTLAVGETLDVRRMPAWIRGLVWLSGRDIQRETIQILRDSGNISTPTVHCTQTRRATRFQCGTRTCASTSFSCPKYSRIGCLRCDVFNGLSIATNASDHFPLLAKLDFG